MTKATFFQQSVSKSEGAESGYTECDLNPIAEPYFASKIILIDFVKGKAS